MEVGRFESLGESDHVAACASRGGQAMVRDYGAHSAVDRAAYLV